MVKLRKGAGLVLGASTALLIPIFWQHHLQAGDLESHLYNAWLANVISRDGIQGLTLATQWTNVLGDRMLEFLLPRVGPDWAERVLASAAVLIFFWGAFQWIRAVTGKRPWMMTPILAMLSYGIVFQMGLMNFYLATGLSLWVMALLWRPTKGRIILATPVAVLAILAHPLPVVWAGVALIYLRIVERLSCMQRKVLFGLGLATLLSIREIITHKFPSAWSLDQVVSLVGITGLTGVEQFWLYSARYLIVAVGMLLVLAMLFLERLDQGGVITDPIAHLWGLSLAAFILLPWAIHFPQYANPLSYIQQRISLFALLLLLGFVGGVANRQTAFRVSVILAAAFFAFLFMDERALNGAESEIAALVSALPANQRVVAEINDSTSGLKPLGHIVDRPCIAHCFSYNNYEAPTGQFRVRVSGTNRVVAPTMGILREIGAGDHVVTAAEAPLYSICPGEKPGQRFCIHEIAEGERTCAFSVPVTPTVW